MPDESGASVAQLVEDAQLTSIDTLHLQATQIEGAEPVEQAEPIWALGIDNRTDNMGFRIRLRVELDFGNGSVQAEVAAAYSTRTVESTQIALPAMEEFVNGVAVMHLLPFLRQAVSDLTGRVFNAAITLPLLQRGQLTFEIERGADGNIASPNA